MVDDQNKKATGQINQRSDSGESGPDAGQLMRDPQSQLPDAKNGEHDTPLTVYEVRQQLAQRQYERQLAAGDIQPVMPRGKWRKRMKRTGKSLLLMIMPAVVGALVFALLGQEGPEAMQGVLDRWWWPMSVFRLAVYAMIAWLVWPYLQRRVRESALWRLAALRSELFAESEAADGYVLQVIAEKEEKTRRFHVPGYFVFAGFVLFDAVFLQLPYFIK